MMLLPTSGYQLAHTGTGGRGWNPPRGGTNVEPPQKSIGNEHRCPWCGFTPGLVGPAIPVSYDGYVFCSYEHFGRWCENQLCNPNVTTG